MTHKGVDRVMAAAETLVRQADSCGRDTGSLAHRASDCQSIIRDLRELQQAITTELAAAARAALTAVGCRDDRPGETQKDYHGNSLRAGVPCVSFRCRLLALDDTELLKALEGQG